MVTAVSWFIEQFGSMVKEFRNLIIIINPLTIRSSFKELAQTLVKKPTCSYQFIGNYQVQNWIIYSRWMHMNWYMLASKQVSWLAL